MCSKFILNKNVLLVRFKLLIIIWRCYELNTFNTWQNIWDWLSFSKYTTLSLKKQNFGMQRVKILSKNILFIWLFVNYWFNLLKNGSINSSSIYNNLKLKLLLVILLGQQDKKGCIKISRCICILLLIFRKMHLTQSHVIWFNEEHKPSKMYPIFNSHKNI